MLQGLTRPRVLQGRSRPARPTRSPRVSRLLRVDNKLRLVSHASAKVSGCRQCFQRRRLRVRPLVRRSALAPYAKGRCCAARLLISANFRDVLRVSHFAMVLDSLLKEKSRVDVALMETVMRLESRWTSARAR